MGNFRKRGKIMENNTCAFCKNVIQVEEWDSDRVLNWECGLSQRDVKPEDTCKKFEKFNDDNNFDEEEMYF